MVYNLSYLVYHVEFLKDLFSAQYYFCYILMIFISVPSYLISICLQMIPTDCYLFYENKNISVLETTVNAELNRVYDWLCANMLSLNIQKSNYVIFHPPQRNIRNLDINLMINEVQMKRRVLCYLGVLIDSTLSWKNQVEYVSKKIRRSIGILCKLRYFVTKDILINLYYALIYPFLIYGLISWGNTYESNLKPIYI